MLVLFSAAGLFGDWLATRIVDRAPLAATAGAVATISAASLMLAPALAAGTLPTVALLGLWGVAQPANLLVNEVRVMAAAPDEAKASAASLNVLVCNFGIALAAALPALLLAVPLGRSAAVPLRAR